MVDTAQQLQPQGIDLPPSEASMGARVLAVGMMVLTTLGGLILVWALWSSASNHTVLVGAVVGAVVVQFIPALALYLLADMRDAIWYLAEREHERR